MKRYVTFTNSFHRTSARALLSATPGHAPHGLLTRSQARRLWRKLCGINGCQCPDNPAGTRGAQFQDASHVLAGSAEYCTWYR